MTTATVLMRECDVFSRYLIGQRAPPEISRAYEEAHGALGFAPRTAFDRLVTQWAAWHPAMTWFVDCYATMLLPRGLLRHKLVLTLALLESAAPTSRVIDSPPSTPRWMLALTFGLRGTTFGVGLIASTLVLTPLRMILGRRHG